MLLLVEWADLGSVLLLTLRCIGDYGETSGDKILPIIILHFIEVFIRMIRFLIEDFRGQLLEAFVRVSDVHPGRHIHEVLLVLTWLWASWGNTICFNIMTIH